MKKITITKRNKVEEEINSGSMSRWAGVSENLSGAKNINDPNEVLNFFDYKDLAYYDADLGSLNKPSTIVDLESKEIIRD